MRTIIGLPVGHDAKAQAAEIQKYHYEISRAYVALEWAVNEAKTNHESWADRQVTRIYKAARDDYERQLDQYRKFKDCEKPKAPEIAFIRSMVYAHEEAQRQRSVINRLNYQLSYIKTCGVQGLERKGMMMMNVHKNLPKTPDQIGTPDDDLSKGLEGVDFSGADKANEPDHFQRAMGVRTFAKKPTPPKETKGPGRFGGKGDLYPWLEKPEVSEVACPTCKAVIYKLGDALFEVDQEAHIHEENGDLEVDPFDIGEVEVEGVVDDPPPTPKALAGDEEIIDPFEEEVTIDEPAAAQTAPAKTPPKSSAPPKTKPQGDLEAFTETKDDDFLTGLDI